MQALQAKQKAGRDRNESRHEMETAWKFIRSGAIRLATMGDSELPEIHALMSRYWDRPMDLADATLVHLARREGLNTVFTVDHADFDIYRIQCRRRFRILPSIRAVGIPSQIGTERGDTRTLDRRRQRRKSGNFLAEREGFEPSIEFPLYTLSKRAPSATRPSLRSEQRARPQF